tara:strand:- start:619 stop:843 length:225 start_codon:yes stop_codon:yes gene_type:complete
MIKKKLIKAIPIAQPAFVHNLQIPNFRLILSNQSVGGKRNGAITVRIVKLIVGVDNVSIRALNVSITGTSIHGL